MEDDRLNNTPTGLVPKNYSLTKDIVGSIFLNLFEGIALTATASLFILAIPFVKVLKISLILIAFAIISFFELKGIHNYSLLTALFHYIKWKSSAKKYVFGTADTAPRKNENSNLAVNLIEKVKKTDWKAVINEYKTKAEKHLGRGSDD